MEDRTAPYDPLPEPAGDWPLRNRTAAPSPFDGSSWINVLAGIWLIVAPFVLGYPTAKGKLDSILVGIVVAILAGTRVAAHYRFAWLSWLNALAGIWLFCSPWILGLQHHSSAWIDWIMGIVVTLVAVWSAVAERDDVAGFMTQG